MSCKHIFINEFIVKNPILKKYEDIGEKPKLILKGKGLSFWFKQDNEYKVPKADFRMSFYSHKPSESVKTIAMNKLFTSLIQDELEEFGYQIEISGLNYRFSSNPRGLNLSIGGFDQKQHKLILSAYKNNFIWSNLCIT